MLFKLFINVLCAKNIKYKMMEGSLKKLNIFLFCFCINSQAMQIPLERPAKLHIDTSPSTIQDITPYDLNPGLIIDIKAAEKKMEASRLDPDLIDVTPSDIQNTTFTYSPQYGAYDFFIEDSQKIKEDTNILIANIDREIKKNNSEQIKNEFEEIKRKCNKKYDSYLSNFSYEKQKNKRELLKFYETHLKPTQKKALEMLTNFLATNGQDISVFSYFNISQLLDQFDQLDKMYQLENRQEIEYMFDEINLMLTNPANQNVLAYITAELSTLENCYDIFSIKYLCDNIKNFIKLYSIY